MVIKQSILLIIFSFFLFVHTISFGAETDQLTDRTQIIKDSLEILNYKVNKLLDEAVVKINRKDIRERSKQMQVIAENLNAGIPIIKLVVPDIELWVSTSTHIDRFPDEIYLIGHRGIYSKSNIRERKIGYFLPLSPTIKVANVLFGADKIGHFFTEGWEYYLEEINGRDPIEYGKKLEYTIYGFTATGVFSFADMAANYQGFIFYKNLFDGPNPILFHSGETLKVIKRRAFNFAEYIVADFDELVNPNIYSENSLSEKIIQYISGRCIDYLSDPRLYNYDDSRFLKADYCNCSTLREKQLKFNINSICLFNTNIE